MAELRKTPGGFQEKMALEFKPCKLTKLALVSQALGLDGEGLVDLGL